MPILTNGYMNIIKEPRQQCPSFIDNVDCVYARFLYTLMSTDYINGSGCLNRKVRAVVPKGSTVPSDLHLFTMFVTWSHQRDIDKLIKSMFKN